MEQKKIIKNPLDDYQLLQESTTGGSYFFANTDDFGVETTKKLEGTAKAYIINEETGEPGVVTGEAVNAVPRGDLDKNVYDNTSDVYFYPEYTYGFESAKTTGNTETNDDEEEITEP